MDLFSECIKRVEGIAREALSDAGCDLYISVGGSTIGRPFEFIVREVPENVSISDRATSTPAMGSRQRGSYQVEFSVACQTWAKRKDVEDAAFLVNGWAYRFASAVAADRTLGGLALHAEPYIGRGASAYEKDRSIYLVACDLGVRVKASIDPISSISKEQTCQ